MGRFKDRAVSRPLLGFCSSLSFSSGFVLSRLELIVGTREVFKGVLGYTLFFVSFRERPCLLSYALSFFSIDR